MRIVWKSPFDDQPKDPTTKVNTWRGNVREFTGELDAWLG